MCLSLSPEFPLVSLLQKTPPSPVSCHATGFYPDRATMFWRRDGEELQEDVNYGELLNNHDGTFQMSVDLDLSLVRRGDWSRYRCMFQFSDVDQAIVTNLDPALIKTNWVEETPGTALVIALSAVVALLVVMATVIYIVYRKKKVEKPVMAVIILTFSCGAGQKPHLV
ncbi:major histocompatibility complex class I-related gene protein-like [Channa argus]|uniref:major histocompatibility complex class I-related gene protein-like n=1 Tax=Channa argus TaxID=215402 RepID=UPI0035227B28